ncbi:hypothetical protein ACH4KU_15150 [Streptomyces althioticus]|uniref:hypothetical protein n=1 Tax=Streptomyces TaxID=1883 RepID=UPI00368DE96B
MTGTAQLRESRDFCTRLLGFEATFEAHRYVSPRRPGDPGCELALLDHSHRRFPRAAIAPTAEYRERYVTS